MKYIYLSYQDRSLIPKCATSNTDNISIKNFCKCLNTFADYCIISQ